jgi:hypothetical protein
LKSCNLFLELVPYFSRKPLYSLPPHQLPALALSFFLLFQCTMAVNLEMKISKLLESGSGTCLLGVDKDGERKKVMLYMPANMILHAQLEAGGCYSFNPPPAKKGKSLVPSYGTMVPVVTKLSDTHWPAYPQPISVQDVDRSMAQSYQDLRVTIRRDFGVKDYQTAQGLKRGRAILCDGQGEQSFDLMLWGDQADVLEFKTGATFVFYDVWVKENGNVDRPADRMAMCGSLSAFGYVEEDTLMAEIGSAFAVARSPARKRKLSLLAGKVGKEGEDQGALRCQLLCLSVRGAEGGNVSGAAPAASDPVGALPGKMENEQKEVHEEEEEEVQEEEKEDEKAQEDEELLNEELEG